jgi:hypothetical protein
MQGTIQRLLAIALAVLLAVAGAAVVLIWTPSSTGMIAPASAGEDDETDTTVAGGGGGGGGGDTGAAQGGVGTGFGGTADTFTSEPGDDGRSDGRSAAIAISAAVVALGLGGLALRRTARSRLGGRQA